MRKKHDYESLIKEQEETIEHLKKCLAVASGFCELVICSKCKGPKPKGYCCPCGDESGKNDGEVEY